MPLTPQAAKGGASKAPCFHIPSNPQLYVRQLREDFATKIRIFSKDSQLSLFILNLDEIWDRRSHPGTER
jgi:hypothetical protein